MTYSDHAAMLANRVRKSAKHLRKWARREGVSCYRVYDRDIPELPLAIDWYDGRLHIALYRADHKPHTADPAWLEAMVAAAAGALEIERARAYLKTRERKPGASQYEKQDDRGERFAVTESGLGFWINLGDYLDTGLFLDHRVTRSLVRAEAAGKRVLNLFCYTGSFTVYAAAGGARSTVSVDLSSTYLDWAADNLALNELGGPPHALVRADALAWLAEPARHDEPRYDLVVLDPPTFSTSKRMEGTLDVQRDHVALLDAVTRLTAPGGAIYFSTNQRGFRLDTAALAERADIEHLTARTLPPDFRNRRIHQCYRLVPRP
jgi:23S rRNA G2069 N7-methylase RlmK/C1962 C5-methylase RlmI